MGREKMFPFEHLCMRAYMHACICVSPCVHVRTWCGRAASSQWLQTYRSAPMNVSLCFLYRPSCALSQVVETLNLAAKLRLPGTYSKQQKEDIVDQVIAELSLIQVPGSRSYQEWKGTKGLGDEWKRIWAHSRAYTSLHGIASGGMADAGLIECVGVPSHFRSQEGFQHIGNGAMAQQPGGLCSLCRARKKQG